MNEQTNNRSADCRIDSGVASEAVQDGYLPKSPDLGPRKSHIHRRIKVIIGAQRSPSIALDTGLARDNELGLREARCCRFAYRAKYCPI